MSTLSRVDPSLRPLLAGWPEGSLNGDTPGEVRANGIPKHAVDLSGVTIEEVQVSGAGDTAGFSLVIYRPEQVSSAGCIFYTHGGEFVIGSARGSDGQIVPIVRGLGCVVVSVDYCLAPEAVFPTQIEQCYTGLAWVFEHAESLGIDARKIGVMGDSAGGGLTAALALIARDRGEFALAFQHLIYPMLDDRTCVRPGNPLTGEFIYTADSNCFGWQSLLAREPGSEDVSFYPAPARAESLACLPPTYIMVGALDLFLDQDLAYAEPLLAAGVPTEAPIAHVPTAMDWRRRDVRSPDRASELPPQSTRPILSARQRCWTVFGAAGLLVSAFVGSRCYGWPLTPPSVVKEVRASSTRTAWLPTHPSPGDTTAGASAKQIRTVPRWASFEAVNSKPAMTFALSAEYLEFHDTPLTEAVAQFDARNALKIRVSENAARLRVSGRFRADDPKGFVLAVTQILPVRRRIGRGGGILLVKR